MKGGLDGTMKQSFSEEEAEAAEKVTRLPLEVAADNPQCTLPDGLPLYH